MQLFIKNMNEERAVEALNWRYAKPYDLYNNELTNDSLKEFLGGSYHAIVDQNNELFGYFCIGESAQVPPGRKFGAYNEDMLDVGFGMKPSFTGQGYGFEFCSFIFSYIQENNNDSPHRLTVATFNKRAIHLYEKLGFVKRTEFDTDTTSFITMVKEA
ncbi:GNAT family N-acetyltransferase [Virgibacillus sp. JSM 102003]|uniref:GNAT family N-acetyltransferase n=1 Tax=Virgibacillus sp. JSM 102003 TaxID=1562108 RepID=UPI0035BF7037